MLQYIQQIIQVMFTCDQVDYAICIKNLHLKYCKFQIVLLSNNQGVQLPNTQVYLSPPCKKPICITKLLTLILILANVTRATR